MSESLTSTLSVSSESPSSTLRRLPQDVTPAVSSTAASPTETQQGGGSGANGSGLPGYPNSSQNGSTDIYSYTFLVVLFFLLVMAFIISYRAYRRRRAHRLFIEQAMANGSWPMAGGAMRSRRAGTGADAGTVPVLYDVSLRNEKDVRWDGIHPVSAIDARTVVAAVPPSLPSTSATPQENSNTTAAIPSSPPSRVRRIISVLDPFAHVRARPQAYGTTAMRENHLRQHPQLQDLEQRRAPSNPKNNGSQAENGRMEDVVVTVFITMPRAAVVERERVGEEEEVPNVAFGTTSVRVVHHQGQGQDRSSVVS